MTESDRKTWRSSNINIPLGHHVLVIRRRYESLSILNDILIAVFFVAGSAMFFSPQTETAAKWCFLLGSIDFLLRPAIRLARRMHLGGFDNVGYEDAQDY